MTITDGKDPDEFIKAKGPDMFRVLVEGARPLVAYKIDQIKKNYDLGDTEQLLEFTESAARILAEIKKPVEYELYLKLVAKECGISEDSLKAQADIFRRRSLTVQKRQEERSEQKKFEKRTGGRRDLNKMRVINAEKLLLNFMADDKTVLKRVADRGITPEDFTEDIHKRLAEVIYNRQNNAVDINEILAQFTQDEVGTVSAILLEDKNTEHKIIAYEQPLGIILEEKRKKKANSLLEQGDLAELDKILKEKRRRP